ncbi:acetyl-CoA synthetase-like protein [Fomitiporia mediterranea MF3/22]|uniref:acetyl-CoA synthetase-like protein n=1 Tax=Fomitiporia mediterranea (strain MF3/22) TaxID=694068 RepID=UPI0004409CC1|nr:acetyl-CoA synthetase-like protein [Fomitiporia mediterranea MF3/22]EJD03027.1 acetyl-CoA synthetase-like protein [Fomitiporia mediterranea MF3/22]
MSALSGSSTESIRYSHDPVTGSALIILNRPGSLNAINAALLSSLVSHLEKAAKVKVCIITGSGTSFCSGEDLKETLAPQSSGRDPEELRVAFEQLQSITRLMTSADTIFIAAVNGWAIGGGAEIALAADIVIASPDAEFRFPEINHGHAPTGGVTGRLPQLIGFQQAKRLMLLGHVVPSTEALAMNMVTEIAEDPLSRSYELAAQLMSKSARSLAAVKVGLEQATFPNAEAVLEYEMKAASQAFADESATKAFEHFRLRKSPRKYGTFDGPWSTLPVLLKEAATSFPTKTFLRFGDSDFTYFKFYESVLCLAFGLRKAGILEGDVVAAIMLNSEEMVRLWFATMTVGAIWAPLHTEFRGLTLRRALELVAPKIMIVDDTFLSILPTEVKLNLFVKGTMASQYKHWTALIGDHPLYPVPQSPSSTTSLLFTSGTTGPSKACELNHQYFISAGRALINSLHLRQSDVLFCPFPLCHADASSLTVIPALLLGATAAISTRFSASTWWDEIRQTKATVADFMGATLSILYKAPERLLDRDNTLRLMWGVPVPVWVDEFERRFNLKVYEVYGSTETGIPVVQPIDRPRVKGSCGVALPEVNLKILQADGSEAEQGVVGELIVRQPKTSRFSRYYRNLEGTASSLRDGWLYTGDYCHLDHEGNLYFVGRKKQVIRRRGENISAFEVEEALLLHPDILECAAYGVPAPELTEEDLVVSIVKRPGGDLTEEAVHAFAVNSLAKFQVPRYIGFCDALPRTGTGKLEVFKLQEAWSRRDRSKFKDFEGHKKARL